MQLKTQPLVKGKHCQAIKQVKLNKVLDQVVGPWRWSVVLSRVTLRAGSTAAGLHASHPHATLVQYTAVDGIARDLYAAKAASAPA